VSGALLAQLGASPELLADVVVHRVCTALFSPYPAPGQRMLSPEGPWDPWSGELWRLLGSGAGSGRSHTTRQLPNSPASLSAELPATGAGGRIHCDGLLSFGRSRGERRHHARQTVIYSHRSFCEPTHTHTARQCSVENCDFRPFRAAAASTIHRSRAPQRQRECAGATGHGKRAGGGPHSGVSSVRRGRLPIWWAWSRLRTYSLPVSSWASACRPG
jgi:hypothetical protein